MSSVRHMARAALLVGLAIGLMGAGECAQWAARVCPDSIDTCIMP